MTGVQTCALPISVNNILGKNDFDIERIKVVFDSKKVTDHHAIIPTVSSLSDDLSNIPESEAKVYRLISNKLHASVGYPLVENTTKIVATFDGFEFTSSGKVIVDEGFTKYLKEYKAKKDEDIELPDVSIGDVLSIENKEIKEKFTNFHHSHRILSSVGISCRISVCRIHESLRQFPASVRRTDCMECQ